MPSKPIAINTILILSLAATTAVSAAGQLSTLFTTPQERQLINSNRYKSDEVRTEQPVNDEPDESPYQILSQEEVSFEYRISGISLSADGAHTVWINAMTYEDDARLEDGSRVKVISGKDIRVRITAPDGKQYFGTSGETIEVTYMATVEN